MLVIAAPLYVAAAGYSAARVGLLLSAATAGSVAMTLGLGYLSDRLGRKRVLIVISLLAGSATLAYSVTTEFWILAVMSSFATIRGGGAGSGGGFGPFYPAEQALIASSSSDRDRNSVFAALSLAGVLAAAAGSLVAGLPHILQKSLGVGAVASFRPVFWIAAGVMLAGTLAILPIRERRGGEAPGAPGAAHPAPLSTRRLIGRLWLTNGVNGFVIGVIGPFLTYWFSARYGVGSGEIAVLYAAANALTAVSFVSAPLVARSLGTVRAIVTARAGSVLLMGAMAMAPGFLWAAAAYAARVVVNSIGMPLRQSYVMGISEEHSRSEVAAFGNLPAQATGLVAPTIAAHLLAVSMAAPIWVAAAATAANAALFAVFFRKIKPPEERAQGRVE